MVGTAPVVSSMEAMVVFMGCDAATATGEWRSETKWWVEQMASDDGNGVGKVEEGE